LFKRIFLFLLASLFLISAIAEASTQCEKFYLFDPALAAQKIALKEQLKNSLNVDAVSEKDQTKLETEDVFKNIIRALAEPQNNIEFSVQSAIAILKLKSGMRNAESFLQNFESLNRPSIKGNEQSVKVDVFNSRLKSINEAIMNLNPNAPRWWSKLFSTAQSKEYASIKQISEQIDEINKEIEQFEKNEIHLLSDAIDMVDLLKRNKQSEAAILKYYDALSELYSQIENSGLSLQSELKSRMLSQITIEMTSIQNYTRLVQTSHQNLEKNLNAALSTLEIIEVQKSVDLSNTLISNGITPSVAEQKIKAFERILAVRNARAEKWATIKTKYGKKIVGSCIGACVLTTGAVTMHIDETNTRLEAKQTVTQIATIKKQMPDSDFHIQFQSKHGDVIHTHLLEKFKIIDSNSSRKWIELWGEMTGNGNYNTPANRVYMYSLLPQILKQAKLDTQYTINGKSIQTDESYDYYDYRFSGIIALLENLSHGNNRGTPLSGAGPYLQDIAQAFKITANQAAPIYGAERVNSIFQRIIEIETKNKQIDAKTLSKTEVDETSQVSPEINAIISVAGSDRTSVVEKDRLKVLAQTKAHEHLRLTNYYRVNSTEMSKLVFAHTTKNKLTNDDIIYLLGSNIWSSEYSTARPTTKAASDLLSELDQAINTNYSTREETKYIDINWVLAKRIVDSYSPTKMSAIEATLITEMLSANLSEKSKFERDMKQFILAKLKAKINPHVIQK
jgi:hypothetical protein